MTTLHQGERAAEKTPAQRLLGAFSYPQGPHDLKHLHCLTLVIKPTVPLNSKCFPSLLLDDSLGHRTWLTNHFSLQRGLRVRQGGSEIQSPKEGVLLGGFFGPNKRYFSFNENAVASSAANAGTPAQTHCGWMFFPCLLILLCTEGQDTSRKARGAVLCSVRAHSEAWFPLFPTPFCTRRVQC